MSISVLAEKDFGRFFFKRNSKKKIEERILSRFETEGSRSLAFPFAILTQILILQIYRHLSLHLYFAYFGKIDSPFSEGHPQ